MGYTMRRTNICKVIAPSLLCLSLSSIAPDSYAVPLETPKTATKAKTSKHTPAFSNNSWYLDVSGGLSSPMDSDVGGSASSTEFTYDEGFSFSTALGYRPEVKHSALGYMRFEGALGYQQSEIGNDGVSPTSGTAGDTHTYTAMLNGYYDFKNATSFIPYIGAGLGIARVSLKDVTRVNISDDSDTLGAYQLMAGFSVEPESLPYTSLHLGYRFFSTIGDAEFTDSTGAQVEVEQANHNIEGGIRWHF